MQGTICFLAPLSLALVLSAVSAQAQETGDDVRTGPSAGPSPPVAAALEQERLREQLEREQQEREQQGEQQPGQKEQPQQFRSGNPPDDPGRGLKSGSGSETPEDIEEVREGPYGDRQKSKKSGSPRH